MTTNHNRLMSAAVLLAAFVAVFLESYVHLPRFWFGAQVDLLPALMVYVALFHGINLVALAAVVGGLWFDSLSANPAGITILPLFAIGLLVSLKQDLILRDQRFAQFWLGLGASALVPLLGLVSLWMVGESPLVGVQSFWQWVVVAVAGGLCSPVIFAIFERLRKAVTYQSAEPPSFRPDREIIRGRY